MRCALDENRSHEILRSDIFWCFFRPPFHFFVLFFTPTGNGLRWKAVKAGLRHFGKKGKEAVTSELTQMHDMHTYEPIDPENMTEQQKSEALNSLIFPTEKHNGDVKPRMCGNGSK